MKKPYTQQEIAERRAEFEGNPYWRVTKIDAAHKAVHTERTGVPFPPYQEHPRTVGSRQAMQIILLVSAVSWIVKEIL